MHRSPPILQTTEHTTESTLKIAQSSHDVFVQKHLCNDALSHTNQQSWVQAQLLKNCEKALTHKNFIVKKKTHQ